MALTENAEVLLELYKANLRELVAEQAREALPRLDRIVARLDGKGRHQRFRVALVGESQVGKSTLLNAILGRRLLPAGGIGPLTALAMTVVPSLEDRARIRYHDATTFAALHPVLRKELRRSAPSEATLRYVDRLQLLLSDSSEGIGYESLFLAVLALAAPTSRLQLAELGPLADRVAFLRTKLGVSEELSLAALGSDRRFREELQVRTAGWLAPLIEELHLELYMPQLPDVELVDTPGVGTLADSAAAGDGISKAMASSDLLLVVVRNSGVTNPVADVLQDWLAHRDGEVGLGVAVVVTHVDDLLRERQISGASLVKNNSGSLDSQFVELGQALESKLREQLSAFFARRTQVAEPNRVAREVPIIPVNALDYLAHKSVRPATLSLGVSGLPRLIGLVNDLSAEWKCAQAREIDLPLGELHACLLDVFPWLDDYQFELTGPTTDRDTKKDLTALAQMAELSNRAGAHPSPTPIVPQLQTSTLSWERKHGRVELNAAELQARRQLSREWRALGKLGEAAIELQQIFASWNELAPTLDIEWRELALSEIQLEHAEILADLSRFEDARHRLDDICVRLQRLHRSGLPCGAQLVAAKELRHRCEHLLLREEFEDRKRGRLERAVRAMLAALEELHENRRPVQCAEMQSLALRQQTEFEVELALLLTGNVERLQPLWDYTVRASTGAIAVRQVLREFALAHANIEKEWEELQCRATVRDVHGSIVLVHDAPLFDPVMTKAKDMSKNDETPHESLELVGTGSKTIEPTSPEEVAPLSESLIGDGSERDRAVGQLLELYTHAIGPFLREQKAPYLDGLERTTEILRRALEEPHLLDVGFVGESQVGKSSLINALLGRTALPAGGVGPLTAREIVVEHGERNGFDARYHNRQKLNRLTLPVEAYMNRSAGGSAIDERSKAEYLVDQARKLIKEDLEGGELVGDSEVLAALKASIDLEGRANNEMSPAVRERVEAIRGFLGREERIIEGRDLDKKAFRKALALRSSSWLSPLVSDFRLTLAKDFLENLTLVDLPGIGVLADAAGNVAAEFVRTRGDVLVVVVRNNGITNALASLMEETGVITKLLFGGNGATAPIHIILAVTHLDDTAKEHYGRAVDDLDDDDDKDAFPDPNRIYERLANQMVATAKNQLRACLRRSRSFEELSEEHRARREQIVNDLCDSMDVFCVAAPDHLLLKRQLPGISPFITNDETTSIPALRDCLLELVNERRQQRSARIELGRNKFALASRQQLKLLEEELDPQAVAINPEQAAELKEHAAKLTGEMKAFYGHAAGFLEDTMPANIKLLCSESAKAARRKLRALTQAARSMHFQSLNASFKREGRWDNKNINYPASLTCALVDTIAADWPAKVVGEIQKEVQKLAERGSKLVLRLFNHPAAQTLVGEEQRKAHKELLEQDGVSAVTWTDDRLGELRDRIQAELHPRVLEVIGKVCEIGIDKGENQGSGARDRIVQYLDKAGLGAIDEAVELMEAMLAEQYGQLKRELECGYFAEHGDPIARALGDVFGDNRSKEDRAAAEALHDCVTQLRVKLEASLHRVESSPRE